MIDILNPDDSFSVYDFKLRAQALIEDITSRKDTDHSRRNRVIYTIVNI